MESLVQADKHGLVQERSGEPSGYTLNSTDFNTERGQYPFIASRSSEQTKPQQHRTQAAQKS